MTSKYTKKTSDGTDYIERIDPDGSVWSIPCDPANSDYQRYLNPEAEQSTPIVIDEAKAK
jgi:hypothetical protein